MVLSRDNLLFVLWVLHTVDNERKHLYEMKLKIFNIKGIQFKIQNKRHRVQSILLTSAELLYLQNPGILHCILQRAEYPRTLHPILQGAENPRTPHPILTARRAQVRCMLNYRGRSRAARRSTMSHFPIRGFPRIIPL